MSVGSREQSVLLLGFVGEVSKSVELQGDACGFALPFLRLVHALLVHVLFEVMRGDAMSHHP
jgi:hypothetical protein